MSAPLRLAPEQGTPYDQLVARMRAQANAAEARHVPVPAPASAVTAGPALRSPSGARKVHCPLCHAKVGMDCIDLRWPEATPPVRRGLPHHERRAR